MSNSIFKIKKLAKKEVLDFFPVIRTLRKKMTKKELAARMKIIEHISEHHFWGAFRGAERVGFGHASIALNLSPGGKDLYLNDLIVVDGNRKSGVGSRLMEKVLKLAERKKCRRILITVRTNNLPALNFYAKKGFERRGWARLVQEI